MAILASSFINWSALWKIVLAALIGGAGVVIVFGFLLYGVKIANNAKSGAGEWGGYALAGVCGLLCVGAVVAGIVAMTDKPKSKPAKPAKSSLVVPSRTWS